MAIEYVKRLAGPYVGEGQSTFTFGFLIFKTTDVYVATALSNDEASTTLENGVDYTVQMNDDQNSTPGGTITLSTPLVQNQIVVIGSCIAYTQELQLTNYTRFPPEQINIALDRIVIQIQQLLEMSDRALRVPATSTTTPEEMIERLLAAQSEAAAGAAEARDAANDAKKYRDEILREQSNVIQKIVKEGEKQVSFVVGEGDTQVDRLKKITEETLVGYGVGGRQETWTLSNDVSANAEITLPGSMTYVVGRNHLRISWNGLTLYPGENFDEIGTIDVASSKFKTLFSMKSGDVLNAWTVPLGRGDMGNVEQDVAQLTSSVAELSRKAAFHNVGEKTK